MTTIRVLAVLALLALPACGGDGDGSADGADASAAIEQFDSSARTRARSLAQLNLAVATNTEGVRAAAFDGLESDDPDVRLAAVYALGLASTPDDLEVLAPVVELPSDAAPRLLAATAALALGHVAALPVLIEALDDETSLPVQVPALQAWEQARFALLSIHRPGLRPRAGSDRPCGSGDEGRLGTLVGGSGGVVGVGAVPRRTGSCDDTPLGCRRRRFARGRRDGLDRHAGGSRARRVRRRSGRHDGRRRRLRRHDHRDHRPAARRPRRNGAPRRSARAPTSSVSAIAGYWNGGFGRLATDCVEFRLVVEINALPMVEHRILVIDDDRLTSVTTPGRHVVIWVVNNFGNAAPPLTYDPYDADGYAPPGEAYGSPYEHELYADWSPRLESARDFAHEFGHLLGFGDDYGEGGEALPGRAGTLMADGDLIDGDLVEPARPPRSRQRRTGARKCWTGTYTGTVEWGAAAHSGPAPGNSRAASS